MALRVVYRSYGGENMKGRPAYYSKLLCLLSFLRALEAVDADVVFLNDGPVPQDRLDLMRRYGTTVDLPRVGMRGSYRAALELATDGRWPAGDVVWFSEDDYLYLPEALERLVRAVEALDAAEYFALYGSTPARPAGYGGVGPARPRGWRDLPPWTVDGQAWTRILSTTSSFGARVGALAEDLGVFRFCMVPHRTMLRDHDTCLTYQGFEPHRYGDVLRSVVGRAAGTPAERLRAAALAPFHLATNLRSHRRGGRRRMLVAADPNLATHAEEGSEALGRDWAAVAEDVRAWSTRRGLAPEGRAV